MLISENPVDGFHQIEELFALAYGTVDYILGVDLNIWVNSLSILIFAAISSAETSTKIGEILVSFCTTHHVVSKNEICFDTNEVGGEEISETVDF